MLDAKTHALGHVGVQVSSICRSAQPRTSVAPTGLRDPEAAAVGFDPLTVESQADDHKAYYPGSRRICMHVTGDRATGRLLGVQLFGHLRSEIAKRIDIAATAIFHGMSVDAINDLDLSYTPPLGSPWAPSKRQLKLGRRGSAPISSLKVSTLMAPSGVESRGRPAYLS
jgi:Pyridine nucleotide-disulphide oxidoreductase, dimerisation domain